MTYTCHLPHPLLQRWIRFYWILESDTPYVHRATADGCAELVFHYDGLFSGIQADGVEIAAVPATLRGPASHYSRYSCNGSFGIFGVYLYPFALQRLLNIPADILGNSEHSLVDLFGTPGATIADRVNGADGNAQRRDILNNFFLDGLKRYEANDNRRAEWMIQQVMQTKGTVAVQQLATASFLSTRQFERQFRAAAGFAPKLYSRIIRFQSAAALYGTRLSMTELAHHCGYYDQAHFIHEFRQFSGHAPSHYFKGLAEGTAWRG